MYLNNLWRAVLAVLTSRSILHFLLNIDRLGNAICAGYYEFTISGRIGYYAKFNGNRYWLLLQWVVDSSFYPIDGKDHCLRAYCWEKAYIRNSKNKKHRRGNDIALTLLSILVLLACLILTPIIWLISLIQSVKQKFD